MDRVLMCLILFFGIALGLQAPPARAQDDSDMGRPPPPDAPPDFEEIDDEMMEDEGFRPPPPPPPVNSGMNMPAPGDFRPPGGMAPPSPVGGGNFGGGNFGGGAGAKGLPAKVKFKVVEGEYWEKGKKRSRGEKVRAD